MKYMTWILCFGSLGTMGFSQRGGSTPHIQRRNVTAWLQKNDWQAGIQSLQSHSALIDEASPAWYAPTSNGGVAPLAGVAVDDPALLAVIRNSDRQHIILRPIVMNAPAGTFDANLISPILGNAGESMSHAVALIALTQEKNYGGIDLDYEGLSPGALPSLASFVETLAAGLHAAGKTLAVDIQPKYFGISSQADDSLRRIGVAADSVRIMLYPEHTSSTPPGPLASLGWIRNRLTAALNDISGEKISLGMATYAMTWDPSGSGTWVGIVAPALAQGVTISRDSDDNPSFQSGSKIVYFEDATSIKRKIEIGEQFGINRFALWRLGGEDPAIWDVVQGGEK